MFTGRFQFRRSALEARLAGTSEVSLPGGMDFDGTEIAL